MRFLSANLFLAWLAVAAFVAACYLFRPRPRKVDTSTLPFFLSLAREYQDSAWLKWLKYLVSLLLSLAVAVGGAAILGRLIVAPDEGDVRTVVLLVDRSASMGAKTPDGRTRLEEAVARLQTRLSALPAGVGVAVVAYDRRPEVVCALTPDHREAARALAALAVRPMEDDPESALRLAREIAAVERPAVIWRATDNPSSPNPSAEASGRSATETPAPAPSATGLSATGTSASATPSPSSSVEPTGTAEPAAPIAPPVASDIPVEEFSIAAAPATNVGITLCRLRRLPLERAGFEVFVQLSAVAEKPLDIELEISHDDKLAELRRLTVTPGKPERLLLSIAADPARDRTMSVRVKAPDDGLADDDVVMLRVPRVQPLRVVWITPDPDPFTELALASLAASDIELLQGTPKNWPPKDPLDVVLFDGWLPPEWPTDIGVVVVNPPASLGSPVPAAPPAANTPQPPAADGLRPPASVGPLAVMPAPERGRPSESMRPIDRLHPVLYGVSLGRLSLARPFQVETHGALAPLVVDGNEAVVLAGEYGGRRVVVLAFDPSSSERLSLTASYPLLLGNAAFWTAAERLGALEGTNYRTGDLVEIAGSQLTWVDPANPGREHVRPLTPNRPVEIDRLGFWRTDAGASGGAALLSERETSIAKTDPPAGDPRAIAATRSETTAAPSPVLAAFGFGGDLARPLLWLIGLILVAESFLYHRHLIH